MKTVISFLGVVLLASPGVFGQGASKSEAAPKGHTAIDELVMEDLRRYLVAPDLSIAERWYGVYAKHPDQSYVAIDAAPGVRIVTAVGGSGMTLSFGLAEQMINEMSI